MLQIEFGKYAGRTVAEIADADPDYLRGLIRERVGPVELRAEAAGILEERGILARAAGRHYPPYLAWALLGALGVLIGGLALFALLASTGQLAAPDASRSAVVPTAMAPTSAAAPEMPMPAGEVSPTPARLASLPTPVEPATRTTTAPPAGPVPAGAECGGQTQGVIRAEEALDNLDKIRVVEFEVVRTYNSGRAVFLNSHDPYQGYFEVVIFPDRWGGFSEPPEEYFDGKCVAVRGKIQLYQGTPEIVLGTAEDIQIVE